MNMLYAKSIGVVGVDCVGGIYQNLCYLVEFIVY